MTDFSIWTPKFDGDAPPNWKAGMAWTGGMKNGAGKPSWFDGLPYTVPSESLAAEQTFDVEAYLALGRANADKLPDGVAEALGPERDWARKVADEYFADDTLAYPQDLASLLRTRCRPIANDTVTDEWLTEFAKHRNWELSHGMVDEADELSDVFWRVHAVNGGRNDREWKLIGFGETPQAAIQNALTEPTQ